LLLRD